MVVVGKTEARVTSKTGKLIKAYPYATYGKKKAVVLANKQLYAIEKSKAREHLEGGVGSTSVTGTLSGPPHKPYNFAEEQDIEPTPEDYVAFFEEFFEAGASVEEDISEEDVDAAQLKMGTLIEYEHTTNEQVARKIAMDHLAEIKDYYTRLIDMEVKAKGQI